MAALTVPVFPFPEFPAPIGGAGIAGRYRQSRRGIFRESRETESPPFSGTNGVKP